MQLGRYIRAVTGHNNLLYHLHNMQNDISPICRFCLQQNEEFHHLATECPPLWWERHHISSQEIGDRTTWTPQQIINFTYIPKINDAFVKPLFVLDDNTNHREIGFRSSQETDDITDPPRSPDSNSANSSDGSFMDVSSLEPSSDDDDGMSVVSIISE